MVEGVMAGRETVMGVMEVEIGITGMEVAVRCIHEMKDAVPTGTAWSSRELQPMEVGGRGAEVQGEIAIAMRGDIGTESGVGVGNARVAGTRVEMSLAEIEGTTTSGIGVEIATRTGSEGEIEGIATGIMTEDERRKH